MINKNIGALDYKALSAAVLPIVGIAFTKLVSPIWESVKENASPNRRMDSMMLLPTGVQSTSYYASRPGQNRR